MRQIFGYQVSLVVCTKLLVIIIGMHQVSFSQTIFYFRSQYIILELLNSNKTFFLFNLSYDGGGAQSDPPIFICENNIKSN